MVKILVADDHPLVHEAIQVVMGEAFPDQHNVMLEATSMAEAHRLAAEHDDIDLVLMDLLMPGMEGMSSLVEFRHAFPALPLVVISCIDDMVMIGEAFTHGVAGYIPKTLPKTTMIDALCSILSGETFFPNELKQGLGHHQAQAERRRRDYAHRIASLTPQQLRVLKLIAKGKPNKIIAYELGISETTVKAHTTIILRKLGVHSRTQAVLAAQTHFATFVDD